MLSDGTEWPQNLPWPGSRSGRSRGVVSVRGLVVVDRGPARGCACGRLWKAPSAICPGSCPRPDAFPALVRLGHHLAGAAGVVQGVSRQDLPVVKHAPREGPATVLDLRSVVTPKDSRMGSRPSRQTWGCWPPGTPRRRGPAFCSGHRRCHQPRVLDTRSPRGRWAPEAGG